MKVKHPESEVTVKLKPYEVEKLITAAREISEAYDAQQAEAAARARWAQGPHQTPGLISGATLLILTDLAKALKL